MENLKTYLEFIKFKITLFSTIIGAGIYLFVNKKLFVDLFVNEKLFKILVIVIVIYGIVGFLTNIFEYNKRVKEFKDEFL